MSEAGGAAGAAGASGGASVGGADSVAGADNAPSAGDRSDVSAAADNVGGDAVDGQAAEVAGGPGATATDGFDRVAGDEAGLSREQRGPAPAGPTAPGAPGAPAPAAPGAPPAGQPPGQQPPALRDGMFLHDPRQLTPDQAKELQQLLDSGRLSPHAEQGVRGFLEDYRNNRDSIFPDHPEPYNLEQLQQLPAPPRVI